MSRSINPHTSIRVLVKGTDKDAIFRLLSRIQPGLQNLRIAGIQLASYQHTNISGHTVNVQFYDTWGINSLSLFTEHRTYRQSNAILLAVDPRIQRSIQFANDIIKHIQESRSQASILVVWQHGLSQPVQQLASENLITSLEHASPKPAMYHIDDTRSIIDHLIKLPTDCKIKQKAQMVIIDEPQQVTHQTGCFR